MSGESNMKKSNTHLKLGNDANATGMVFATAPKADVTNESNNETYAGFTRDDRPSAAAGDRNGDRSGMTDNGAAIGELNEGASNTQITAGDRANFSGSVVATGLGARVVNRSQNTTHYGLSAQDAVRLMKLSSK